MMRRSLTTIDDMVAANTKPATVTTLPVPPHRADDAGLDAGRQLFLEPGHQQQVVVRADRQQGDHRHRQHQPVQFDTEDVLPDEDRQPE